MLKPILSCLLSIWIFFVSAGFTVEFHYCAGELEGWSLLGEKTVCEHHEVEETSCCSKVSSCDINSTSLQDDCCLSTSESVYLEDDFLQNGELIALKFLPIYLINDHLFTSNIDSFEKEELIDEPDDWILHFANMPVYKQVSSYLI